MGGVPSTPVCQTLLCLTRLRCDCLITDDLRLVLSDTGHFTSLTLAGSSNGQVSLSASVVAQRLRSLLSRKQGETEHGDDGL